MAAIGQACGQCSQPSSALALLVTRPCSRRAMHFCLSIIVKLAETRFGLTTALMEMGRIGLALSQYCVHVSQDDTALPGEHLP
eukprot:1597290-Amphidinium_carterae.1